MKQHIQVLSAPCILGLRDNGVQRLPEALIGAGLLQKPGITLPVIKVPTLNERYDPVRDQETQCLNPRAIHEFSTLLSSALKDSLGKGNFSLVLGGDCCIMLGIMHCLKRLGKYGLVFVDAHADFYEPEKSDTGEVADMDLALITGRGPEILTNIDGMKPYVNDEHVFHIGQRDQEEARQFGSQDIRETGIRCFSFEEVKLMGLSRMLDEVSAAIDDAEADGYWLHFDTDVLSDEANPAVQYHLPGGFNFEEVTYILQHLLATGRMKGMSVTVFDADLDRNGIIARQLAECVGKALTNA